MVVGGYEITEVEVFSPNGGCQHILAPIPIKGQPTFPKAVLAYIDDMIYVCGSLNNKHCWIYSFKDDSWAVYSDATYFHQYQPGKNDASYFHQYQPGKNDLAKKTSPAPVKTFGIKSVKKI